MKRIQWIFVVAALFLLVVAGKKHPVTFFMVGDSTMANKDVSEGKPERGWGMMFANFFTEDVVVDNHARNGRSSKSFIDEGLWQNVLDKIKPGDYVFIQFGHNDEKNDPHRHTDAGTTFDENLRRMVKEAKAKGANLNNTSLSSSVNSNMIKDNRIDYTELNYLVNNEKFITLKVWDTSGEEAFNLILENFFTTHSDIHHCITLCSKAHIVGEFLLRTNRRDIQIMGYDMVGKNAECLRQGSISFLIAQHAYQQGYACIDSLFMAIVLKKKVSPVNYMPIELLTKENVEFYRRTQL